MPISYRSARGSDDAPALITVHDACAETDRIDRASVSEYLPNVEWYGKELIDSPPEDWVIAEAEGVVIGYGHTRFSWTEQDGTRLFLHLGWVMPAWRGQGVGTDLLARLEARCREKATGQEGGRPEYGANASGTEDTARQLLTENGYSVLYTVQEMDFPVSTPLPDIPLPVGYELRPVLPDHYRAIWQNIGDAYYYPDLQGRGGEIATEANFERYFHSPSADPELWIVAWAGSRIAGQALCRIENGSGEVYEVSVGHAHRRRGLARALLTRGLRTLQARNVSRIRLFTKKENPTDAWRLYESVGFRLLKEFPRWRKPMRQ